MPGTLFSMSVFFSLIIKKSFYYQSHVKSSLPEIPVGRSQKVKFKL
ncbi:hypothetical protein ESA_03016 [Cronobacter sakazakii ATCC BAA-894]|uniref:Uncharacterized protein n=1 Tax=Cronobacter sakazakii (strain ATCC BAA-894) TaxID=290339 RepID=A7MN46_CROS8|nr:hypothetical protein ESA_03016 [Cronobacter sakazakii ATCC BAA-894]